MSEFDEAKNRFQFAPILPMEEMLEIYALYKQGTVGDINIEKPKIQDFKGIAKWEAWYKKKGKSIEEAKTLYIEQVDKLVPK